MTATELEMLACFEVEPDLLDADVPWFYNYATYQLEVAGFAVLFAVQPASRNVRLTVHRGEQRLFELIAAGAADVCVSDESGVDAVRVLLSAESWVRLQLRPTLEITQGFRT